MKSDSTRGRWFILQNTIEVIKKRPLTGYGWYGFQKEYMQQQASYFGAHSDSIYAMLADDIRHPLNEFLNATVCYGIFVTLLLCGLQLIPLFFQGKSDGAEWSYALLAVFVFSLLSYPLKYPLSWFAIVGNWLLLAGHYIKARTHLLKRHIIRSKKVYTIAGLIFIVLFARFDYTLRRWGRISYLSKHGHPRAMMGHYKPLYKKLSQNPDFLYDYAIESYYALEFWQARSLAEECAQQYTSYDLSLLRGDICSQLHLYDEALHHYEEAALMCPVRFAPFGGMLDIYLKQKNDKAADSIRHIIRYKRVKVPSAVIDEIRNK